MRKGVKWAIAILVIAVLVMMIGPVIGQLFGVLQGGHP